MARREIIAVLSENRTSHAYTVCGQTGEFWNIINVTTCSNHYSLKGHSQHTVGRTTMESGKIAQYERSRPVYTVPRLRRLDASLSQRTPGFDPVPVHVKFVVDNVALGQVFLRVVPFSFASIFPLMLQTRLHFNLTLVRRTSGQAWGLSKIWRFGYQCSIKLRRYAFKGDILQKAKKSHCRPVYNSQLWKLFPMKFVATFKS